MRREGSLSELSDGRLYELNDMVKAGCGGCVGCSQCCHGMGNSIILDPLDVFRLTKGLGVSFQVLLADQVELNVVDGVILPNLKMKYDSEACAFLDANGRCTVHGYRPGVCRLFPLGRFYENKNFKYFIQIHECSKQIKTKVKVQKWIDTPDLKEYEPFIVKWHYFLNEIQELLQVINNAELERKINLYVLNHFYLTSFGEEDHFYEQFQKRLDQAQIDLAALSQQNFDN